MSFELEFRKIIFLAAIKIVMIRRENTQKLAALCYSLG